MRLSMSTTVILAALLQLSGNAGAQDFLQQLDARTEDAASRYNSRFIDERLYFAKRHRLVTVNTSMLRESSIDGITLFDGEEKVHLTLERIQEGQIHGAATWIGSIVFPPGSMAEDLWSKADIEKIEKSGFSLEQVVSQIGRVELQILYWDIDSTTGEAFPSAEHRDQQLGPEPVAGAVGGEVERHAFATVRGRIDLSILGRGIYQLEPLRNSPRYHILYEVDPTKEFGVVEADSGVKSNISEEEQRKLDYEDFLKSLPPRRNVVTKGELQ